MRKTGICILALSVAMGTGACGMMGNLQNTAQTETNAGDYLIDEVGDMMEGVQSETELDLVVPDEHPGEGMTEGADDLLQQAPAETEKTEGADALPVSPAETETEMSYGPLGRPLKELIREKQPGKTGLWRMRIWRPERAMDIVKMRRCSRPAL